MSTRLKGKQLEYFNLCNNEITITKTDRKTFQVFYSMKIIGMSMFDSELKDYMARWVAIKMREKI